MITRDTYMLYRNNIAVVNQDGSQYSYGEILSIADEIFKDVESRSLVFCLAQNSLGSLFGYFAFLQKKIVPLMLNSDINSESLNNLNLNTYGYQKKIKNLLIMVN